MDKEVYIQISIILATTAANEKEYAEIWYKRLIGIENIIDCLNAVADGELFERLFPVAGIELLIYGIDRIKR